MQGMCACWRRRPRPRDATTPERTAKATGGAGPATTRRGQPKGTSSDVDRSARRGSGKEQPHAAGGRPPWLAGRGQPRECVAGAPTTAQGSGDRVHAMKLAGNVMRTTFKVFQKSNSMIQMPNQFFYTQEDMLNY